MAKCALCDEVAVAYAQVFQGRKQVGSYPLCLYHGLWVRGFEEFGQDWARSGLAEAFGFRRGSLPKVRVSLSP
jgi:hypothetical protein